MAYTRINWKDGESGGTPLSAENLNKMDKGIYDANSKSNVLYSGSIKTYGNYQLRDNVNNYDYIEVFAGRGTDFGGNSVKLRSVQGSGKVPLFYVNNPGTSAYIHLMSFSFSGTTFSYDSNTEINLFNNDSVVVRKATESTLSYDTIHKIVGWKD